MKKLPYLCFALASLFKAIGKSFIGNYIPVDELSIPGWFIIGDVLVRVRRIKSKLLKNCIEHTEYGMPDEYKKDLQGLIKRKGQKVKK